MDGIESEDWLRGGKLRDKWEKYLRGPESKPTDKGEASEHKNHPLKMRVGETQL
jgi:hypothetical protein